MDDKLERHERAVDRQQLSNRNIIELSRGARDGVHTLSEVRRGLLVLWALKPYVVSEWNMQISSQGMIQPSQDLSE